MGDECWVFVGGCLLQLEFMTKPLLGTEHLHPTHPCSYVEAPPASVMVLGGHSGQKMPEGRAPCGDDYGEVTTTPRLQDLRGTVLWVRDCDLRH